MTEHRDFDAWTSARLQQVEQALQGLRLDAPHFMD